MNSNVRQLSDKSPCARPRSREAEGEIIFDCANRAPMVAPGEYEAVYVHHETQRVFMTPKLFVWFRLVTPGPAYDVMVYRAYRVKKLTTKAGKNGGFVASRMSDIYHDLGRILDIRLRPDRVSAAALRGIMCRVRVRKVVRDYKGRAIPEWDQYSVVDALLTAETATQQLAISR